LAEKYKRLGSHPPARERRPGTVTLSETPNAVNSFWGLQARVKQTLSRINLGVAVKDDDPLTLAKTSWRSPVRTPRTNWLRLKLFDLPTEDEEQQKRAVRKGWKQRSQR